MATVAGTTLESVLAQHFPIHEQKWNRALVDAAHARRPEKIQQAVRSGADINVKDADGYTALMICVTNGDVDSVRNLKNWGADLRVTSTAEGYTALMIAVNARLEGDRDAKMVDILLESDVGTSYVDYLAPSGGPTALMIALDAAKDVISLKLMAAGADVNKLNASGYSALTYAAMISDLSTINFLLKQKPMLAINQMWDAVDLALKQKNISLFLKLWGEIQNHPQKFIDIGVASVIPEAVRRIIEPESFASPGQDANMTMLVANHPGPNLANSAPSASIASREPIQDGEAGAAPSAGKVRKQRPTVADDDDVSQAVRPHNLTTTTLQGQSGFEKVQLPSP
ncbi:ankyrin repeat domain-containing protein [Acidovorax sp. Be4]|uniref:Ankyrin repeat domain-containing protein n=1 Tax=Acidovorax bellezanensis TaxID=2976702 RepID=A0ABT2PP03_9BURK|nr:ankyrin repeat domain-containing protein [Acidovorax sp. Be4]MCT9812211.1 ankyrin repeat domain-containing protein [Acidovorax sp. Be4]